VIWGFTILAPCSNTLQTQRDTIHCEKVTQVHRILTGTTTTRKFSSLLCRFHVLKGVFLDQIVSQWLAPLNRLKSNLCQELLCSF